MRLNKDKHAETEMQNVFVFLSDKSQRGKQLRKKSTMTVFPSRRRRKGGALNLDLCTNTFPVTGSYV